MLFLSHSLARVRARVTPLRSVAPIVLLCIALAASASTGRTQPDYPPASADPCADLRGKDLLACFVNALKNHQKPTPTPTAPPTPAPTPTPTQTLTPKPTPTTATATTPATAEATPVAQPTPTLAASPTPIPTPSYTPIAIATVITRASPTPTASPSPSPSIAPVRLVLPRSRGWLDFWSSTIVLLAIGCIVFVTTAGRRKKEHVMNYLEIESPHAGSVVIAGRLVTFSARFDDVVRAERIVWSVASEPEKKAFGATFSRQWSKTGVDQIVASVDGLRCGIVVYVFETPSGGSTVDELMRSIPPPPGARTVDTFEDLPERALRMSA